MVFVATGLNHKTAPLAVREKVALLSTSENALPEHLLALPFVHEAVILSTCNRTELYCEVDDSEKLLAWLSDMSALSHELLSSYVYQYEGIEAVQHLLRVASGLDSMMLGEPQILGQLKQAFRYADERHAVCRNLRHIFPFVFSASKRIRTQSGIGNNPISVASAAVRLIGQIFSDYKNLKVFIIGSGETAALVAKYLYQQGVQDFSIASRTRENADKLALKWHANPLSITDIPAHLPKADVVISATACPLPFIDKAMVQQAIGETRETPLFFLDLAVPRDIALEVSELTYAHLYNIDDLHLAIEKGLDERRNAAASAEALITPELERYKKESRIRAAQKVISDYREQMQLLAEFELRRATKKMQAKTCQNTVMREFSDRLFNKLTHATTIGLRQLAADGHSDILSLAEYLLNTDLPRIRYEDIT